jgi:hypothetical protein
MFAFTLVESLSLLGGALIFALLLYLILRPLKINMTITHKPPSDPEDNIPEEKED